MPSKGIIAELLGSRPSGPVFLAPGENTAVTSDQLGGGHEEGAARGVVQLGLSRSAPDLIRYLAIIDAPLAALAPIASDAPVQRLARLSAQLSRGRIAGDAQLAVILTTSGSTGQPKIIGLEASSLVAFAKTAGTAYGIRAADRILVAGSPDGDYYLEELLLTLGTGATGVLLPRGSDITDPGFPSWLAEFGVTVLDIPLTRWRQLVAMLRETGTRLPASVRILLVGGESLLPDDAAAARELSHPGTTLINLYGPAETTIVAVAYKVPAGTGDTSDVLPIGTPMPGVDCYVVTADLRPVPPCSPGELLIGGRGLARGYLGDPIGTATRFVPDSLSGHAGRRLYRTGDRVRQTADGNYQFLGRMDNQVKIRGFRVEPGEVEAALLRLSTVNLSAVRAIPAADGRPELVAYIPSTAAPVEALRMSLAEMLPDFMIPTAWVRLNKFPLTPTGKIDKNRLPDGESYPETSRGAASDDQPVASATEHLLAKVWAEVLRVPQVSPLDNFFYLGGQSLEGVQVVSRLRKHHRIDLRLADLLRRPVLRDLAGYIDQS